MHCPTKALLTNSYTIIPLLGGHPSVGSWIYSKLAKKACTKQVWQMNAFNVEIMSWKFVSSINLEHQKS